MKKGDNSTYEGWAIDNMKPNSVVYTQKSDHEIAALASSKKRKIKTEKLIVISGNKTRPKASVITKVTLL